MMLDPAPRADAAVMMLASAIMSTAKLQQSLFRADVMDGFLGWGLVVQAAARFIVPVSG
jgi:hypothetical protein